MVWYDDGESAFDENYQNDYSVNKKQNLQKAIDEHKDLYKLWRQDSANRISKGLPTLTLEEFAHKIVNNVPEVIDTRPNYAKPVLEQFNPDSNEYTNWSNILNQWEQEDINKAKETNMLNSFVQSAREAYTQQKKDREYEELLNNFAKQGKSNIDTSPVHIRFFV